MNIIERLFETTGNYSIAIYVPTPQISTQLQNYLFNQDVYEIAPQERLEITNRLRKEMIEIYSGMNIY